MYISGNLRRGDARQSADGLEEAGSLRGTDSAETPETLQLFVWYPGVTTSAEEQVVGPRVGALACGGSKEAQKVQAPPTAGLLRLANFWSFK